jgi:hypothetical protein
VAEEPSPEGSLIASKPRATPREIHVTPTTADKETKRTGGKETKQMN